MGDAGFLLRAHCELDQHNPERDLLFFDGKATGKRGENGSCPVELEREVRNQDGEISIVGGGRSRYRRGRGDAASL